MISGILIALLTAISGVWTFLSDLKEKQSKEHSQGQGKKPLPVKTWFIAFIALSIMALSIIDVSEKNISDLRHDKLDSVMLAQLNC